MNSLLLYSQLTLPPHIKNKPWISRKNDKAVKIMIKTNLIMKNNRR